MNILVKRGEIYYFDLGIGIGSEQRGKRPCLVVQNNIGNKYSPCTIILPLTTSITKATIPTQIEYIIQGNWGLIYGEQVRCVDKRRICGARIDYIEDMSIVNQALCISLALECAV